MIDKLRDFFCNKKILLLGFGLEGQSTARLLEKLGCEFTVWEKYEFTTPIPEDFDIIVKSPGIPLYQKIGEKDPRITGQADLFLRFCESTVVGVTGTKGKSTTSSLIHHILCENGVKSRLIGNIGVPAFDIVEELSESDTRASGKSDAVTVIVFELSCHQLEYCQASPNIAVFLNLYEDHLDHYIDFNHCRAAKENIFKFQRAGDVLIRGNAEPALVCSPSARVVFPDKLQIDETKPKLRGVHNIHNIAIATKAATLLNIDEKAAVQAAYSFSGLEHRLESFEIGEIRWVNDSISTIPEAAIAAVAAFPETDTLIIGGMDRGIDYSILIDFIKKSDLNIIALPDSGHKIADAVGAAVSFGAGPPKNSRLHKVDNMGEAVALAKTLTKRCCVLSPAAASYGFYKNFEERGRHFKDLVNKS